jgi:pilus assembly protein CpaB
MKWSIIALVALGLLAGLCAALLVISMQAPRQKPGPANDPALEVPESINMLVAKDDLSPRDLVVSDSVDTRTALRKDFQGTYTDPAQIIGKVLLVPMKKGQPFTAACFAGDNERMRLASALEPGKRAVCLTLEDPSGIERIIYPGSMVDVLATLKTRVDEENEQSVSFTLLQNVMVLAVGQQTIVTEQAAPDAKEPKPNTDATVTLIVDSAQAEQLRLAAASGKVSVVMRNPMDTAEGKANGVRFGALAPILVSIETANRKRREAREREAQSKLDNERKRFENEMERQRFEMEKVKNDVELTKARYEKELETLRMQKETVMAPRWETLVFRGGVVDAKYFPIEAGQ